MTTPPSYNDLFGLLRSQLDAFSKEITETMGKTLTVQQTFHKFHPSLVAVEKDTSTPTDEISDAFQKAQKIYDGLLWAGRELATSAAGANCLGGFSNMLVPELILNPEVPREDLIIEVQGFMEEVSSETTISRNGKDFSSLDKQLRAVEALIEAKTGSAADLDPEIASATAKLEKAKADLKGAKAHLKELIPYYLKHIGLDETSPSLLLFIGFALKTILKALTSGPHAAADEAKKLNDAEKAIKDLEVLIVENQKALDKAIAASKKAAANDSKWISQLSKLRELIQEVTTVEPSFDVLVRISGTIRKECEAYLEFLNGSNGQDPVKKAEVDGKLKSSAELYKALIPVLTNYASTVVM